MIAESQAAKLAAFSSCISFDLMATKEAEGCEGERAGVEEGTGIGTGEKVKEEQRQSRSKSHSNERIKR